MKTGDGRNTANRQCGSRQFAGLENPPKQFMAGGDAISAVVPVLEQRLIELDAYEELSKSTNGSF
ncbi:MULTISPECIES: hypothetical protein [Rhizobium]|uniref:Uncharacterized protein n=1 Tax=Rhizobium indicum TaxID=2583231 RepID=A0ABX6PGA6_9HYPH|nr:MULTISPECIES: hypothetical protein [Rhizobium]NNU68222.1 hypothetical protein [Rhizobium sp. WYCCWR 11152]NYT30700.1 hypothetical protein [Rhizobium sp. WYCCWR 11128]QKK16890.1 hypothetical protein FFM53_010930 [Rhizobium indicum]